MNDHDLSGRRPAPPRDGDVELSILITTQNRSGLLRTCLESLNRQTAAPERFEVVVVDDGSSDDTVAMLGALPTPYSLTVVARSRGGSSAGRNAAAECARGRLLLFIDDDETADPGLVSAHLDAHSRHANTVVLGAIGRRVPEDADRLARLGCEDANWHNAQLANRPATFWDCYGGNLSCSREAFRAAGGYATDLVREVDTEFGYRLHAAGQRFVFAPEAQVIEFRTRGWRGIVTDARIRGEIAIDLYGRHPEMLPAMPLGGSAELSVARWRRKLGELLLALHASPAVLGAIGLALPVRRLWKPWYALVLRHAYWTGVRAAASPELWRQARSATLILGYHAFGAPGEKPSRYVVPGRRFARQLGWLKRRRYNVISLGEYLEYRESYRFPPPKTIVLTIDDGYVDNATIARPLLERFGFRATLFLITGSTDETARTRDRALAGRPIIAPAQARELLGGAFEIAAHTRTHRTLTAISADATNGEIAGSKEDLERTLGEPVTAFAYPFGAASPELHRMVAQAGYLAARGTQPGRNRPATPSYALRWLEICGTYSFPRFAATLVLGELRRPRRPRANGESGVAHHVEPTGVAPG